MKRKYYFFWSLLLGLMGVTASAQITSTSAINNNKTFTIKSAGRGYLYYDSSKAYLMSTSNGSTLTNDTPNSNIENQFALLRLGSTTANQYYLYSVAAGKFVEYSDAASVGGQNVRGMVFNAEPTVKSKVTLTSGSTSGTSGFVIKYADLSGWQLNVTNWNHYSSSGIKIFNNTDVDAGSVMVIKAVNTAADLSDALSKILLLENPSITIESLLTSAAEHLALAGKPGYPTTTSAAYTSLKEKAEAASPNAYKLYTAINTFETETDVAMPQDGKAYTFTFKHMNGTRTYLYWNGSKITSAVLGSGQGLPETAKFICRTVTDGGSTKYMFVNNAGKYLVWWGGSGDGAYESNNGYTSAYASTKNLFQVIKFTSGSNVQCTNEELFGCVGLKGTRQSGDAPYFILKNTAGGAVASSLAFVDKTTTNANYRTSAVMIEEAEYPNTVTFKNTDITNESGTPAGTYALATFSAPFATVIPAGVTAYIATQDNENGNIINMSPVGGSALPAGAGFILSGTADATVAMVPATDEVQASTSGTLLRGSAGEEVALSPTNDYVLGQKEGHVAFYHVNSSANVLPMNRAYLHFSGSSVVKMNFNHTTTGIEAVSPAAQQDGPIYDLSGRRVSHMSKGGIYIRNGKKILVK